MSTDGASGPGAELHVAVRPDLAPAQPGAGGVHHVAFRTPDTGLRCLGASGCANCASRTAARSTAIWFRSLYFREPNGVLFEIATDGPGFAVDEPLDRLGEKLVLPPFLEPQRAHIEAGLKPL